MGSGVVPLARATRSAKPTGVFCVVRLGVCMTRVCGEVVPVRPTPDVIWRCGSVWAELEGEQADRAISTGQLHALLRVHVRPIDVVVYDGS